ncbi:response regulator transcription factor [Geosporobacter ferrireducens]|uniref:Stage 0 sporulation protein A homolog n=1 Tax=Geosporobacter ferrireducens TaxID=1424294 RepID=A0A1D8GPJ7_9FIRM|nr:response regulator transcription factor [Geosporobacter ferrireducens]AOT72880.1 DNA-binding response regulator [Geosporobacter ferrireducens]MTI55287.1 response regulator transcription factor [Geosporobacter ferrireducens]
MTDVLIADDDKNITELISDSLADEGLSTAVVHDGLSAVDAVSRENFRLILLDIMMPQMDGLEVCREIRNKTNAPILFVTAKNRTIDTIVGLEIGGDDYIAKPFVVEELVAKVKAHIRRDKRSDIKIPDNNAVVIGDLVIYRDNYEVTKAGNRIELSTREFQLLLYMLDNIGKVLTREQIFDAVWGIDYSDIGTVTVTIKNLRDKIEDGSKIIKTVWGVGYKLVSPVGEA